jgi:hypothetical protein
VITPFTVARLLWANSTEPHKTSGKSLISFMGVSPEV